MQSEIQHFLHFVKNIYKELPNNIVSVQGSVLSSCLNKNILSQVFVVRKPGSAYPLESDLFKLGMLVMDGYDLSLGFSIFKYKFLSRSHIIGIYIIEHVTIGRILQELLVATKYFVLYCWRSTVACIPLFCRLVDVRSLN